MNLTDPKLVALEAAYVSALALARAENTQANREAVVVASAALSAAIPPRKARGPACRAGKRQAAEQRARTAENFRRAAARATWGRK
jgi:hypothetical protein